MVCNSNMKGKKKITFFSSSLLWPKMVSLSSAASLLRPSLLHLRFSRTSSMGMFSCTQPKKLKTLTPKIPTKNKHIYHTTKNKKKELQSIFRSITKSTVSFNTASKTSPFSPIFSPTQAQILNFFWPQTNQRSKHINQPPSKSHRHHSKINKWEEFKLYPVRKFVFWE